MNPIATHIPALLACLRHTAGPVLELGSGWFSAPILSAFATDRLVRTVETNREWHSQITAKPCKKAHECLLDPNKSKTQSRRNELDRTGTLCVFLIANPNKALK